MPKYIKSHSNYVLKSKHQDINDGTIYERDITTIGGIGDLPNGQTPIYRSNNFIVSVRSGGKSSNQYNSENWKENETSGIVWNLESVSGLTADTVEDNDTKIVLKQDYYDLNDFAYYGSLTELFRTSVTDIVARFPGELYVTNHNVYYTSSFTENFDTIKESIILGDETLYEVSNPFGINIHSKIVPEGADKLKYFADGGYNNYDVISGGNVTKVSSWTAPEMDEDAKKGDKLFELDINGITIYGYIGNDCEVVYLSSDYGISIRPNESFLDKFYNDCDNFEKLLMNKDTDYKAIFSVIRENDYGYYRELVPFQFPKGEGGYNIDVSEYGFNAYTEQMVKIGSYYDEYFTDNLWRSMTHEAIKNFDWTYTREFQEGDEEEYVFGGQRIQKALRIFAREFDEILSYINNIKNVNRVTYDERSNLPDYFLTDAVENVGWDVKLIYPYTLIEKDLSGNVSTSYSEEGGNKCEGQLDNTNDSGIPIIREFSQDANMSVTPYHVNDYGYFIICSGSSCRDSKSTKVSSSSVTDTVRFDECALGGKGALKNVIRSYSDETEWSHQKVNNVFLRRLKINSPHIWRHKGTVEGIEMILGMFGLKSERLGGNDYKITEYSSFTHRIKEPWDAVHQDYRINWVNSTKTIAYDNRTISNYNKYGVESTRMPYQGIPVSYRDEYVNSATSSTAFIKRASLESQITSVVSGASSGEAFTREDGSPVLMRYLYPNFNSNEELDGNIYFQMNGGWLSKIIDNKWNFQFDLDNNIVYTKYEDSASTLYRETVRNIRRVDDINELLSIPTNDIYNGVICNVTRVDEKGAVINGLIYPIKSEWYGEGESAHTVDYVVFTKSDGYVKVGLDRYFDSTIIVYDNEGNETLYDIDSKNNGYEIKAYFNGDSFICKEDSNGDYSITNYVRLDSIWNYDNYTNYFALDDVNYVNEIARIDPSISGFTSGWRRLNKSDSDYIKVNTITNYNKGNNPHNGNMVYDNGHEYFTYFKRIFKYASDNELFDGRCYNDLYKTIDEEINKYGFDGLIDDDELIKFYDSKLINDSKIHYFGNYKTKDKTYIYGDDENRLDGFRKIYGSNIEKYNLGKDAMINGSPYPSDSEVDEVTNQIVNNKRFTIEFNLHYNWYSNQGQCELKYIDDVVMSYLTQMIPSTTILQIKYTSNNNGN